MNNKNLGEVIKETRTLRTHLKGYINDCLTALNGNYITKQEYEYDELYQLTKVTGYTESNKYKLQTPDLLSEYTQEFKFDSIGNMTQKKSTEWVKYNRKVGDDLNYNTLEYTIMPGYAHRVQNIGGRYFEYDAAGNIIVEQDGKIDLEDSSKYYKIEEIDENKYIADSAWGYYTDEDRENKKSKVYRRTYEWDDKNQLIKSQDDNVTVCYTYGSDGQRASKYTENSETLYTNDFWVFHVSGSVRNGAGIINKNIYLGKMRVVTKVKEAFDAMEITERQCQYFYHSDHLGSAQLVTDNNGNEYQRIEYTPYGETWIDLKATQNDLVKLNYKFTAKELDEETGLYYYGARYLNPKYSMWLSADPAMNTGEYFPVAPTSEDARSHNQNLPGLGGVFNTVNLNLYHYAANNPICYIDPDGRSSLDELRVIAKTIKSTGKAGNRDIHFAKHLRGDGCFARACIIADYLREKGYKVNYAYVNHPKMPNSENRFKYHIAACVEIDGENYVVDPIYNHEGEYSGLSKFEAWKNFQNPLDDIPVFPESGILSGYDENGNVEENLHIQGFYDAYNKNKKLSVPDYAEKQLEHYEKTYNPKTGKGELEYNGL